MLLWSIAIHYLPIMLTTQLTETESSTSITETNTDVEQTEEAKNCENCHLP